MKDCPRCGRKVEEDIEECPVCSYGFGTKQAGSKEESYKPKLAGYMMIVSAISGILMGLLLLFNFWGVQSMLEASQDVVSNNPQISEDLFNMVLKVCGVLFLLFSSLELTGAIFSFKRKKWGIAVFGALVGIFLIGIFFLSTILSIIALILLIGSKKEFI